jgi:integrase
MLNHVKNHNYKSFSRIKNRIIEVETATLFLDYLDQFIVNAPTRRVMSFGTVGLAYNTIRTYKSLYRVVGEFQKFSKQKLYLHTIDRGIAEQFTRFLKFEKKYSDNYAGQQIKLLKVILRDAEKCGFIVHPFSGYIESFKQKSSDRIIHVLTPEEILKIKSIEKEVLRLKDSYKWLLIGLSIGQRVSDLLKLNHLNIRKASFGLYIDIVQQKTKKPVTVGVVDPRVIEILEHEFPKEVSQVQFNKEIKAICKLAGIKEKVSGYKNNPRTKRKELKVAPKYEFVTSHIMRRSFATNYYGKIETPLLMNITGHTKESTFLTYIGTNQNKDALADLFMQKLSSYHQDCYQ